MRLDAYPRPDDDSGIGFVYGPDARRYSPAELRRYLPELRALGASWLALPTTTATPTPEFFLRELLGHGIEPVVGIAVPPSEAPSPAELRQQLRAYADAGLRYVCFGAHPNLMASWPAAEWLQPNLVGRFVARLLPALATAQEVGLTPLLPPLHPNGEFADIAFFEAMLDEIAIHRPSAFDRLGVAIVSYSFGRPLRWGKGGPDRWPDAHPYIAAPGSEDHRGFRLGEWYDALVRRRLGYSLPLIAVEGGAGAPAPGGGSPDPDAAVAMADAIAGGELPDAVFCANLGLLFAGDDSSLEATAYCKADGGHAVAATALRARPRQRRAFTWEAAPKTAASVSGGRPIYHYVLLPKLEPSRRWRASDAWQAAEAYIRRFRPACGFNAEEAANAEFVTIVGDGLDIAPATERLLRAAGCKVERVAGADAKETRRLLDALVKEGKRFASF